VAVEGSLPLQLQVMVVGFLVVGAQVVEEMVVAVEVGFQVEMGFQVEVGFQVDSLEVGDFVVVVDFQLEVDTLEVVGVERGLG